MTPLAPEGGYPARTYGGKYDGKASTTEIAQRFRADVKAAQAAGDLPVGLKLSVRTHLYSMGSSINVKVVAVPAGFRILNPDRLAADRAAPHAPPGHLPIFTPLATGLITILERMLNAYNHDGSDTRTDYFDVKFHSHVLFASELENAERDAEAAGIKVAGPDEIESSSPCPKCGRAREIATHPTAGKVRIGSLECMDCYRWATMGVA